MPLPPKAESGLERRIPTFLTSAIFAPQDLYKRQAELLISEGYADAGYVQVNIDDCWSTLERDPVTDEQVADPDRFPSGIKALSKYMHDRDLKMGLCVEERRKAGAM
jgi:hypothetical protein